MDLLVEGKIIFYIFKVLFSKIHLAFKIHNAKTLNFLDNLLTILDYQIISQNYKIYKITIQIHYILDFLILKKMVN